MSRLLDDGQRLATQLKSPVGNRADDRANMVYLLSGASLFLGDRAAGSDRMAAEALSWIYGPAGGSWRLCRSTGGKPYALRDDMRTDAISITRSDAITAIAVGTTGPLGLDGETVERVARNATIADSWLSKQERTALGQTLLAERPIELTCRWVLKEAYGKALEVGLGYDLESVSFAVECDRIVVQDHASTPFLGNLDFALYWIDRHIFALAYAKGESDVDSVRAVGQEAACLPRGQRQGA